MKKLLGLLFVVILFTGCGKKEVVSEMSYENILDKMIGLNGYHVKLTSTFKGEDNNTVNTVEGDITPTTGKAVINNNEGYIDKNKKLIYAKENDLWYKNTTEAVIDFNELKKIPYEKTDDKIVLKIDKDNLKNVVSSSIALEIEKIESDIVIKNEAVTNLNIKITYFIAVEEQKKYYTYEYNYEFSKLNDVAEAKIPDDILASALDASIRIYTQFAESYALYVSYMKDNQTVTDASLPYGNKAPSKVNLVSKDAKVNGTIQFDKYVFTITNGKVTNQEEAK